MKGITRIFAAAAIAIPLCACAGKLGTIVADAQTVVQKVKATYKNAPKTVYTMRAGYDIALSAADQFKKTECASEAAHGYCSSAIPKLRAYNHAALDALNAAETFVRAHPDLDATAVIQAAEDAVTTFAQVETDLGVPAK